MIINLYHNGASLDLISKSSDLSIQEVEKIIEQNDEILKILKERRTEDGRQSDRKDN